MAQMDKSKLEDLMKSPSPEIRIWAQSEMRKYNPDVWQYRWGQGEGGKTDVEEAQARGSKSNLDLKNKVQTSEGKPLASTFHSDDGKHTYTGAALGMRQWILQWHESKGMALPRGFENRPPQAIVGMARGMMAQEKSK